MEPLVYQAFRHVTHSACVCRVGYLTLFGGEPNNNGTDPSKVYEEYKRFEGLLTKLARGTLRAGKGPSRTSLRQRLQQEKQISAVVQ